MVHVARRTDRGGGGWHFIVAAHDLADHPRKRHLSFRFWSIPLNALAAPQTNPHAIDSRPKEGTVSCTIPLHDMEGGGDRQDAIEVVSRLARIIRNTPLDCECLPRLDQTLVRFMALEHRRIVHRRLVDACTQRERIKALLVFLGELDELRSTEPDQSVYVEMACLFEDIANAARHGADLMRQLAPLDRIPAGNARTSCS